MLNTILISVAVSVATSFVVFTYFGKEYFEKVDKLLKQTKIDKVLQMLEEQENEKSTKF